MRSLKEFAEKCKTFKLKVLEKARFLRNFKKIYEELEQKKELQSDSGPFTAKVEHPHSNHRVHSRNKELKKIRRRMISRKEITSKRNRTVD